MVIVEISQCILWDSNRKYGGSNLDDFYDGCSCYKGGCKDRLTEGAYAVIIGDSEHRHRVVSLPNPELFAHYIRHMGPIPEPLTTDQERDIWTASHLKYLEHLETLFSGDEFKKRKDRMWDYPIYRLPDYGARTQAAIFLAVDTYFDHTTTDLYWTTDLMTGPNWTNDGDNTIIRYYGSTYDARNELADFACTIIVNASYESTHECKRVANPFPEIFLNQWFKFDNRMERFQSSD